MDDNSSDTDTALFVDENSRIQILETMSRLPRADKEQNGAFIVRATRFLGIHDIYVNFVPSVMSVFL